jgi:mannitol 2-dehydrogenase
MTVKLSSATLAALASKVATPRYDRGRLTPGILHFGVGNFHRAHQAVYLDDLLNAGRDNDWAIVGAGVLPSDVVARAKLKEQDWLTTVVEQDSGHMAARVTGGMIDYLTPGETALVLNRLANPAIRIVSLTITEGGYYIDPASGKFNPKHPDMAADAASIASPKTVFGLILAGLMRRRAAGTPPFTVMSCDNIPHNGHVTKDAVTGLAALVDPKLADWVRTNVAFRTAWSTASRRRPPTASGRWRRMSSASRTIGRFSASRSGNGFWRTISRPGGLPSRPSACNSSTTSRLSKR